MSYQPRAGSVAYRVIAFFQSNPDEELNRGDIAAKFDAQPSSLDTLLLPAVQSGVLLKARAEDGSMVYRLGRTPLAAPKPRIKRRGGWWVCFNAGRAGRTASGATPVEAFREWERRGQQQGAAA